MAPRRELHTENAYMFEATAENLVAMATFRPGFVHPCSHHPVFYLLSSLPFLPMIHCTTHLLFHNQLLSAMCYATSDVANGKPSPPPPPLIKIKCRLHVSRQLQDVSTNCIQRNHTYLLTYSMVQSPS